MCFRVGERTTQHGDESDNALEMIIPPDMLTATVVDHHKERVLPLRFCHRLDC